jgi:hypothetical protein
MPLLRTRLSVCQHKSLSATELFLFSAFGALSAVQTVLRCLEGPLQPPV